LGERKVDEMCKGLGEERGKEAEKPKRKVVGTGCCAFQGVKRLENEEFGDRSRRVGWTIVERKGQEIRIL